MVKERDQSKKDVEDEKSEREKEIEKLKKVAKELKDEITIKVQRIKTQEEMINKNSIEAKKLEMKMKE